MRAVKSFKSFRLDTANHFLWRDRDRVPLAPKGFDVLAYLVGHVGQVMTQDEILEALWPVVIRGRLARVELWNQAEEPTLSLVVISLNTSEALAIAPPH